MRKVFVLFLLIIFNLFVSGKDFILKVEREFEVDYGVSFFDYYNGNFYLSNSLFNQIVICDENGKELKKIGKKGVGPAEFGMQSPGAILIIDEKIFVNDPVNFRIQILDLNGNFLKQLKLLTDIPLLSLLKIYPIGKDLIGLYGYSMETKENEAKMNHKFLIFNLRDNSSKEIYSGFLWKVDRESMKSINPFSAFPLPTLGKDKIFQADREDFIIEFFDMEGKKLNVIRKKAKKMLLKEDLKKYFSEMEEFEMARKLSQGMVDFSFPSHLPVIRSILVIEENLLVQTWEKWYEKNFKGKEKLFNVEIFSLNGEYRGEGKTNFLLDEVLAVKGKYVFILHKEEERKILKVMKL